MSEKRIHIDREHSIQKHGKLWAAECIAVPYAFLAFDRAAKYSQWSHMKQRARGVVPGTPDTLTRVRPIPNIWAEWKQPGQEPSANQLAFGEMIRSLGDYWFCVHAVAEYAGVLHQCGVPLRAGWQLRAEDHDARVQGEIERAEMKVGRVPQRLSSRPSASKIRRVAATGVWAR